MKRAIEKEDFDQNKKSKHDSNSPVSSPSTPLQSRNWPEVTYQSDIATTTIILLSDNEDDDPNESLSPLGSSENHKEQPIEYKEDVNAEEQRIIDEFVDIDGQKASGAETETKETSSAIIAEDHIVTQRDSSPFEEAIDATEIVEPVTEVSEPMEAPESPLEERVPEKRTPELPVDETPPESPVEEEAFTPEEQERIVEEILSSDEEEWNDAQDHPILADSSPQITPSPPPSTEKDSNGAIQVEEGIEEYGEPINEIESSENEVNELDSESEVDSIAKMDITTPEASSHIPAQLQEETTAASQEETTAPSQEKTTAASQEETTVPSQEETTAPSQEETTAASPEVPMTAMRKLPTRETRGRVVTYNDIANSIDPSRFSADYLSSDEDGDIGVVRSDPVSVPNISNLSSLYRSQKMVRKPRRLLKTGFVYDTAMSYHATPDPTEIHPEDPRRIFKIFNIMERHGLLNECKRIKSRRATKEEILLVHNIQHYRKLRDTADLKTRADYIKMENDYDSVYLNSNSFESGLYAVGSLINLMEAVVQERIKNAFAIIRPPGHHAESDLPMGFCLFNNVAIAIRSCMKKLKVKRTLIVDWDIHFGNGTQSIFSEDPNVLYISLHRYEDGAFYPSDKKGAADYTGHNKGQGRTVNIPWPCDGMTDADYLYAFREVVIPIAMEFAPDVVIVSAGFDAAFNDPIGKCNVTPAGYGQMTHMLKSIANGKLVIALEGGYDLNSIAVSALACMNVLLGEPPEPIAYGLAPRKPAIETVDTVKYVQRRYWKCIS